MDTSRPVDASLKRRRTYTPETTIQTNKRSKIISSEAAQQQPADSKDRLTCLSDELLIRIFSLLPLETILLVQHLSHRYQIIARDGQVWKGLYYTRFVLPRAVRGARVGISKEEGEERSDRVEASRKRWLMEERLLEWERGAGRHGQTKTDWKARYRLRFNWSRGKAEVRRMGIGAATTREDASQADHRKLMVRLVNGTVVTAAKDTGLQVWDVKSKGSQERLPLAVCSLDTQPTSLGADTSSTKSGARIILGFSDGGFAIWALEHNKERLFLNKLYMKTGSCEGLNASISAVAYSHPYILNVSSEQILSVYMLGNEVAGGVTSLSLPAAASEDSVVKAPKRAVRLLASLKSHTSWPPLTLSIRPTTTTIIASIAYSIPTYVSGWTVGLQELHLSPLTGEILQSRLTSAMDQGFHSLLSSTPSTSGSSTPISPSQTDGRGIGSIVNIPSSLSYSHPYLLAGHKDNTLTLYMVRSDREELTISKGTRLWGHTSEISGAMIGGRGKAVSVGGGDGEVRVWELEGGRRGRGAEDGGSIRVSGDFKFGTNEPDSQHYYENTSQDWVGFDDEVVVVMNSSQDGEDALVVYDFT